MNNIWTISRRELSSYFLSPIAYVVMAVFAFIYSIFFTGIFVNYGVANLQFSLSNVLVLILFLTPLMTIRALAEERKMGTDELLLTSPITTTDIILGKFLALAVSFLATIGLVLFHLIIVYLFAKPDLGPIISSFIGLLLVGFTFLAIGMFTSALADNQIISGLLGFGVLLLLWLFDWLGDSLGGKFGELISYLSVLKHYGDFNKGVIDTVNIVFYLSVATVFIFLTVWRVESRRWK